MWQKKTISLVLLLSVFFLKLSNVTQTIITLPGEGASLVAVAGLLSLVGPLPSAAPPSVPGALRISLEVSEDMPVTAQPAQLEDAPAG